MVQPNTHQLTKATYNIDNFSLIPPQVPNIMKIIFMILTNYYMVMHKKRIRLSRNRDEYTLGNR